MNGKAEHRAFTARRAALVDEGMKDYQKEFEQSFTTKKLEFAKWYGSSGVLERVQQLIAPLKPFANVRCAFQYRTPYDAYTGSGLQPIYHGVTNTPCNWSFLPESYVKAADLNNIYFIPIFHISKSELVNLPLPPHRIFDDLPMVENLRYHVGSFFPAIKAFFKSYQSTARLFHANRMDPNGGSPLGFLGWVRSTFFQAERFSSNTFGRWDRSRRRALVFFLVDIEVPFFSTLVDYMSY